MSDIKKKSNIVDLYSSHTFHGRWVYVWADMDEKIINITLDDYSIILPLCEFGDLAEVFAAISVVVHGEEKEKKAAREWLDERSAEVEKVLKEEKQSAEEEESTYNNDDEKETLH